MDNQKILYASCITTLEDITKTRACKGKHIFCAFTYKEYVTLGYKSSINPIERELRKQGVELIKFTCGKVLPLCTFIPDNELQSLIV